MIIILIVFICSLIYYTLHSKKITDNEFYILVFLFMIVLFLLNRNKFMEEFSIGGEPTTKRRQSIGINKERILEISNKILDKTIDNTIKIYKKSLELEKKYNLKSKLKEHISITKTFLKNKISSLKTSKVD